MLHEGTVRFVGTPEEIEASMDPIVSDFIHGAVAPKRWLAAQVVRRGGHPRSQRR